MVFSRAFRLSKRRVLVRTAGRLTGAVPDLAAGEARIAQVLDDGRALAKFRQLVAAHGGDPAVCDTFSGAI